MQLKRVSFSRGDMACQSASPMWVHRRHGLFFGVESIFIGDVIYQHASPIYDRRHGSIPCLLSVCLLC